MHGVTPGKNRNKTKNTFFKSKKKEERGKEEDVVIISKELTLER